MKMKIVTLCAIAAFALFMVPLTPAVVSTTIRAANNTSIKVQLKTIDRNVLKEKLQHYDANAHPQQTIQKLIEILNADFHIVLPGVIIIFLFYLGAFFQGIAIGPILYILGAYIEFLAVILIEIISALGMEINWPYPSIQLGKNQ